MDEVRLWSVARTAEEIIAYKDISLASYDITGLNAVYNMESVHSTNKLDNATGETARDGTFSHMSASNQTDADDYWGLIGDSSPRQVPVTTVMTTILATPWRWMVTLSLLARLKTPATRGSVRFCQRR